MKLLVETHDCRVSSYWFEVATPIPRIFGIFAVFDYKIWDQHLLPSGLKHVLIVVGEEATIDLLTEL